MKHDRILVRSVPVIVSLALIVIATLSSQAGDGESARRHWCLTCSPASVADAVANVLLFIPLGVALAFWFARGRGLVLRVIVLAMSLSLAIELLQWVGAVDGRVASVLDIASNGAGAAAGALIALLLPRLVRPSPRHALVLCVAWSVAVHALLFASAWALQRSPDESVPATPGKSSLPFTTGFGWFERPVPMATVDGVQFENRSGSGAIIVTAPERRSHALMARVDGRDRRSTFVPVLFVHSQGDPEGHVVIGQRGAEFGMLVRVNAGRLGMRMPVLAIDADSTSYAVHAGTTTIADTVGVILRAAINTREWVLELQDSNGVPASVRASLRVRPMLGWMLVVPVRDAESVTVQAVTALLVFLLCLPLFHWATAWLDGSRNAGAVVSPTLRRVLSFVAAFAAATSLLVIPALSGAMSVPTFLDWSALVMAVAAVFVWRVVDRMR